MDRARMDVAINASWNSLESIYRAGYDAGRDDAEKEHSARYAVNVLEQLASVLRGEIKDRGASSYVADGLWIALREINDAKDYIGAGGKFDGK
jgi:hypothetical protein